MPSPHFIANIKTFIEKAWAATYDFGRLAAEKIKSLLEKIPIKQRIAKTIAAGALLALLLALAASLIITGGKSGRKDEARPGSSTRSITLRPGVIPQDDVFLPSEPDFVPGVTLDRERRAHWEIDDAAPLWHDPLADGGQEWRALLEKTVDGIMEGVP